MCDLRDADATETRQVPCRVVKSYFDEESLRLVVVVRCFRNANEVLDIGYSHKLFRRNGLVRLWEENGMGSEINLRGVKQVLDLVEILTRCPTIYYTSVPGGKENDGRDGPS